MYRSLRLTLREAKTVPMLEDSVMILLSDMRSVPGRSWESVTVWS